MEEVKGWVCLTHTNPQQYLLQDYIGPLYGSTTAALVSHAATPGSHCFVGAALLR